MKTEGKKMSKIMASNSGESKISRGGGGVAEALGGAYL